jgi:hypothetical protein
MKYLSDLHLLPAIALTLYLLSMGLLLFLRARRRVGSEPHCRKCNYFLVAISSSRCPECGTAITPRNTQLGQRRWRSPWLLASFIPCILATCVIVKTVRTTLLLQIPSAQGYPTRPTCLVLSDLRNGTGTRAINFNTPLTHKYDDGGHGWTMERVDLARIAFEELLYRESLGQLSQADRDQIVDMALTASASNVRPVDYDLGDYLTTRLVKGDLSEKQRAAFYKSACAIELTCRRKVLDGDPVPLRLGREPWLTLANAGNSWLPCLTYESAQIDGHEVPLSPALSKGPVWAERIAAATSAPPASVGRHTLSVTVGIDVHLGESAYPDRGPIMHHETIHLTVPFEVVARTEENQIRLIHDASLAPALLKCMKPSRFQFGVWHKGDIFGEIELGYEFNPKVGVLWLDPLPANIAFDVFARYGGHEYPIGHISHAAGKPQNGQRCDSELDKHLPTPPPTIDIVLRSNPAVARQTLNLYEIWDGELVFPNVPIKINPAK